MAEQVRNYYGNLYGMRGLHFEAAGDRDAAAACFVKVRRFFDKGTQQVLFVDAKPGNRQ
jgi:hypothetical protein